MDENEPYHTRRQRKQDVQTAHIRSALQDCKVRDVRIKEYESGFVIYLDVSNYYGIGEGDYYNKTVVLDVSDISVDLLKVEGDANGGH